MVLYFGDPLKTHYNAAPLRQPFSNINSRLNQLRDVKIYSCWPGAHKWQRSADMKLFSGGTRSPNQGSSLRWQFWFFFHFITSVAVFSITRKKNGTCHSELVAVPLWYSGYPQASGRLSDPIVFHQVCWSSGLWSVPAVLRSPHSWVQCIPDVSGWMAGQTHIWQGAEAEKKQKWEVRKKKVKQRWKKAPLEMQTWMHSAFLTLL